MKQLFSILLLGVLASGAQAQDVRTRSTTDSQAQPESRRITGRVTGTSGEPLAGATVQVINKSSGAVVTGAYTDVNGNYSVSVQDAGTLIVRISYINYATRDIPANSPDASFSIILEESETVFADQIITGYGSQSRATATSAASTLDGDAISGLPGASFDNNLAGRIAGVQVSQSNGLVGSIARVRIRGVNTISGNGDPLYVIDGVPAFQGDNTGVGESNALAAINPEDIESYNFLRDAAATALYGSRGSNGVVVITTKRGKLGKATATYSGTVGWQTVARQWEVLNARDFTEYKNEGLVAGGIAGRARLITNPDGSIVDTDWQKEIYRESAFFQTHNIAVGGGTESTQYRISMGYTKQDQYVIGSQFERGTFASSLDHRFNSWLKVGNTTAVSRSRLDLLNTNSGNLSGNVFGALTSLPNVPVRNANGTFATDPTFANSNRQSSGANDLPNQNNTPNIAYVLAINDQNTNDLNVRSNFYAEVSPLEGLTGRVDFGWNHLTTEDYQYFSPEHGDGVTSRGIIFRQYIPQTRWNLKTSLSYRRSIEKHNFDASFYYEVQEDQGRLFSATATTQIVPTFTEIISGAFITPSAGGAILQSTAFDSYLGILNYNYDAKYLFQASVRNDRLSVLSPDNRSGVFYGVGAGWVVTKEEFFQVPLINTLKIRGSFGQTGNDRIPGGNFPYQSQLTAVTYGTQGGVQTSTTGNPALQWETSDKYNVGLDFELLDNRLSGTFDYFINQNNDLVFSVQQSPSTGLPSPGGTPVIQQNIGSSETEGYELSLAYEVIRTTDLNVSVNANLTRSKSVMRTMPAGSREFQIAGNQVLVEGAYVGTFILLDYAGANPQNGLAMYRRADGQLIQYNPNRPGGAGYQLVSDASSSNAPNTTRAGADDRVISGQPNPNYFGGFGITARYKNWDLSTNFTYALGFQVLNLSAQALASNEFRNNATFVKDRWQNPGDQTDVPRPFHNDPEPNRLSNRFLEDGDFLRMQQVTVGYTLPKSITEVVKVSNAKFFVTVNNVFLLTGYSGIDPEAQANGSVNVQAGSDNLNVQPLPRTFIIGTTITF